MRVKKLTEAFKKLPYRTEIILEECVLEENNMPFADLKVVLRYKGHYLGARKVRDILVEAQKKLSTDS